MRKLFADILKEVGEASTPPDKIAVLKANNNIMVRQLLIAATDPQVRFDVNIPSYRENEETDGYSTNSLYVEYRRLYIFMDSYQKVSPARKSQLLVQILESIDRPDAIALCEAINKDLGKYGITQEVVKLAFNV